MEEAFYKVFHLQAACEVQVCAVPWEVSSGAGFDGGLGNCGPCSAVRSRPPKLFYHPACHRFPYTPAISCLQWDPYSEKSITTSDWHYSDLGDLRSGLEKPSPGTQKPYHTCSSGVAVAPSCTRGHRERMLSFCQGMEWNEGRLWKCGQGMWAGMERGVTVCQSVLSWQPEQPSSPSKVYREPAHLPVPSLGRDS